MIDQFVRILLTAWEHPTITDATTMAICMALFVFVCAAFYIGKRVFRLWS